uniref:Secreted protein n=1 Tax=Trichuris muris TaxID=70415 RepID=A0A5S6QTV0_TRIMR
MQWKTARTLGPLLLRVNCQLLTAVTITERQIIDGRKAAGSFRFVPLTRCSTGNETTAFLVAMGSEDDGFGAGG